MHGTIQRWVLRFSILATPLMLTGCHDSNTNSADIVDIVFAITDLVLAIIVAVD